MEDNRPNPEELLEVIKQEEIQAKQGRLKIFIGMAAGVGKTYAMLEEAQRLKKEGIDIVVGTVNTHGREETAQLLTGLKIIPEKSIIYKGIEFKELDVEKILQLKPEIVVVDELAHSNTPGSTHAKRWQDVIELLDNGINVYTTLNVQHIESLNDIVKGTTDISVKETVPDLIIEKATSIQLIDLTPDGLLARLREGKVYLGDQSQVAIQHFFQRDRLTALREMVLRYAADKIDLDLRRMIPTKEGIIEWRPREKLLVAINHSPHSQKLLRMARRLSANLDAPWLAVHVDNGRSLSENEEEQLAKNIAMARDLGAEVITLKDPMVSDGIERIATQNGVTQIILGRKPRNRFLSIFRGEKLLDRLVSKCKDIDIHVIRQETYSVPHRKKMLHFPQKITTYLWASLHVCLFSLICWFLLPTIGYKIVGILFVLAILSLSLFFNIGPIVFASILYALVWRIFFIPPHEKHTLSSKEDLAIMALYLLTGFTIGLLIDRARKQKELLVKSEKATASLYQIVRHLSSNLSTDETLHFIKEHLGKFLDGSVEFLIKTVDERPSFDSNPLIINEKEKNTAIWAYENGEEAGWSTETLPSAQNLYLPLKGASDVMGLLVFRPRFNRTLSIDEKNFLHTVCQQISNYFEKLYTLEKTKQQDYMRKVEQIYNTILNRFSLVFDMSILTTRNSIKKLKKKLKGEQYPEINDIESSFEIFIKIMDNISAMAQLSETMVPLKKEKIAISKLIDECCEDAEDLSKDHKIEQVITDDLPLINCDYHLMQILVHNLLINAIEHSPPGSTITVEVRKSYNTLLLSVLDEGKGIPPDQLEAIFEKFYRPPQETSPGIGLGLAIAKTIAEVHHGSLKAENRPEKGAKFTLALPIA